MLTCLMYKFSCYRFVETDGQGYDKVRQTESGKKNFKLTHFEVVCTTHHWMVRIYKLKPPKNRLRGETKKSKLRSSSRFNKHKEKSMALRLNDAGEKKGLTREGWSVSY